MKGRRCSLRAKAKEKGPGKFPYINGQKGKTYKPGAWLINRRGPHRHKAGQALKRETLLGGGEEGGSKTDPKGGGHIPLREVAPISETERAGRKRGTCYSRQNPIEKDYCPRKGGNQFGERKDRSDQSTAARRRRRFSSTGESGYST